MIGGAEIFRMFEARADAVELTEVHCAPEGDAIVPPFDPAIWRETAREDREARRAYPPTASSGWSGAIRRTHFVMPLDRLDLQDALNTARAAGFAVRVHDARIDSA